MERATTGCTMLVLVVCRLAKREDEWNNAARRSFIARTDEEGRAGVYFKFGAISIISNAHMQTCVKIQNMCMKPPLHGRIIGGG